MFCPNCGSKTSIEQKFCRACGLGLEKIALSLTEQVPAPDEGMVAETGADQRMMSQKERLERWAVAALSVFGAGILSLFLFFIVYKEMYLQGKIFKGLALLGLMVMMGCGLLAAILFAKAKEVEEAAVKRRLQPKEPSVIATPTRELLPEGHLEPVPSVTDRTTDLLYAEKKDAQRR